MNRKYKALGLALVALIAAAAYSNLGASATAGGHFTSAATHTHLQVSEGENHQLKLGGIFNVTVTCEGAAQYDGTIGGTTVTEVTITPNYGSCHWTEKRPATIDTNGCTYVLTIGKLAADDNTVHLVCPPEKEIEVTLFSSEARHKENNPESCVIQIPPQTPTKGVAYKASTENGKKAITADVTVENLTYMKFGSCQESFPIGKGPHGHSTVAGKTVDHGTGGLWLEGSLKVAGLDCGFQPVDIAATGSED